MWATNTTEIVFESIFGRLILKLGLSHVVSSDFRHCSGAGDQLQAGTVPARQVTEAVMLDFVADAARYAAPLPPSLARA
jgi:hypothetical protein